MRVFIIISIILCSFLFGITSCTLSFDQRQTGDLNVQIGLKNIQLITLLKGGKEEYVDYDYAYDYSEMTIKPQKSTTLKPLNITDTHPQVNESGASITLTENINSTETTVTVFGLNDTLQSSNETMSNVISNNLNISSINVNNTTKATNLLNDGSSTVSTELMPSSTTVPTTTSSSKCRRGFVRNNQGKCEYKIHGTSNALRRIVKLAQKIKLGREYNGT